MSTKKIKAAITISRRSSSDDNKAITITLQDRASGVRFVELHFPIADFMEALTGLAYVEGVGEVSGLENVGKIKEVEQTHFLVERKAWSALTHDGAYSSRTSRGNAYIKEHFAREGWHVATRLGSQNAEIDQPDGKVKIFGSYFRYVDPT